MLRPIGICCITLLSIMLMTACQTLPPSLPSTKLSLNERLHLLSQIQNWQLHGKVGVQTTNDSGSATVDWMQQQNQYSLTLYGPLGAQALKLTGQSGIATIETAAGKRYSASTPEQLLAQLWGFHLPVTYLNYWIRGLSVPNISAQSQYDTYNRLTHLIQQGWNVQFISYTNVDNLDLPSKIFITSPTLKTKLIIYRWKIN